MNALLLSLILLAAPPNGQAPANVPAPMGDREPEVDTAFVWRMGDTVQLVGDGHREGPTDEFVTAMGPPANDANKWFISVITSRGCSHCARLKADWQSSPELLAFGNPGDAKASWAHLNFYSYEDKSQAFRWEKIKVTAFPTILIQPPRDGSYGNPATVVGQPVGYSTAPKLSAEMTAWFKAYLSKYHEKKRADLGPVKGGIGQIGTDPPWAPQPKVEPAPSPFLPNAFPFPIEPPKPPVAPVAPPAEPKPDSLVDGSEVLVITNDASQVDDPQIQRFLKRIRGERRVRLVDWKDVKDRLRIQERDLPTVVVTDSEGRIADKISGRLLPNLRDVGIGDLPWSSILALLSSGFSVAAVVPIGVWLAKKVRAARIASGKAPLVSDEAFDQLAKYIELKINEKFPPTK